MKKLLLALGFVSINTAYALPSNLTEDVYLKSYSCGADSCYLDIELANIQAVSISTFCGDKNIVRNIIKLMKKLNLNLVNIRMKKIIQNMRLTAKQKLL